MAGGAVLVVTIICGAILPLCTSLTEQCAGVRGQCVSRQIQDQSYSVPPCLSGQRYITCLADALTTAERRGVCSPLFLLTYRHDAFSEAAVYQHNCPGFAVPTSLALDGCGRDVAVCGRSALNVYVANNTGDSQRMCSDLDAFQTCMDNGTSTCTDRQLVNDFLRSQLTDYQYQQICVETNRCASDPCLNGAACNDRNGSFHCTCPPRFTGLRCETSINECASSPCLNGATCTDGTGYYTCTCPSGFTGPRCQTSTNACASTPCQNGGTCHSRNGDVICTCSMALTGSRCETDVGGEIRIRLVNGSHPREGRVEVLVNGRWGTVCDDGWGVQDARVVCRQLGYNTTAARAYSSAHFGRGSAMATIWLDEVSCTGTEGQLLDCPAQPLGTHDCRHNEDAGVSCQGASSDCASFPCRNGGSCYSRDGDVTCACRSGFTGPRCETEPPEGHGRVRLVNGSHPREGRVEVLVNGRWGTVCDDGWGVQDARVVCRQLRYNTSAAQAYRNARYGAGPPRSPLWLDDVQCRGSEIRLLDCPARPLGTHNCVHGEDAAVSCGEPPAGSSSSGQCVSGQQFPCPHDLAYYAYPDYDNADCDTYFQCRHGQLSRQSCAPGTKFDSFASRCKAHNPALPLFFTFFCDDVRRSYASHFRQRG